MAPDPEQWAGIGFDPDEIEFLRQDVRDAINRHLRMVHAELGPARPFHEFANHRHETALRQADELIGDHSDDASHGGFRRRAKLLGLRDCALMILLSYTAALWRSEISRARRRSTRGRRGLIVRKPPKGLHKVIVGQAPTVLPDGRRIRCGTDERDAA